LPRNLAHLEGGGKLGTFTLFHTSLGPVPGTNESEQHAPRLPEHFQALRNSFRLKDFEKILVRDGIAKWTTLGTPHASEMGENSRKR